MSSTGGVYKSPHLVSSSIVCTHFCGERGGEASVLVQLLFTTLEEDTTREAADDEDTVAVVTTQELVGLAAASAGTGEALPEGAEAVLTDATPAVVVDNDPVELLGGTEEGGVVGLASRVIALAVPFTTSDILFSKMSPDWLLAWKNKHRFILCPFKHHPSDT